MGNAEKQALKEELEQLKAQYAGAKEDLEFARLKEINAQQTIDELRKQVETVASAAFFQSELQDSRRQPAGEVGSLEEQLRSSRQELAASQAELGRVRSELAKAQSAVKRLEESNVSPGDAGQQSMRESSLQDECTELRQRVHMLEGQLSEQMASPQQTDELQEGSEEKSLLGAAYHEISELNKQMARLYAELTLARTEAQRLRADQGTRTDGSGQGVVDQTSEVQKQGAQIADLVSDIRHLQLDLEYHQQKLDQMIAMVGFHTTKAKNIKAAAKICLQEHGGRVPKTLEALMALPGVGPKMAHLTLLAAFGVQAGLCVDTHVHRIANALGWVKTGSAEETRKALEVWLPKEHWPDLNILLVGLGQQQQQEIQKLVDKCITSSSPQKALRLIARIGVELRAEKFPKIVEIAKTNAALRRLLVIQK
eukprot:gnl/TRDRNA2_/TRDRNA2_153118_c0_seq2.p1 gnl/TRDRNA2_/TRDRNA2_153118_c0~~gnl/TRDRNA2_/TRDRNA2_153118_c0_seq2.p1  ORF type:complete len:497 (+),score=141.15 gnl/TRDRNA2_/TRDRNA2_153118_c0_seq2:217-1491(+)